MRWFPTKEKALEACKFIGYAPGDLVCCTNDNKYVRDRELNVARPIYMVLAVSAGKFSDSDNLEQYIPVTAVVRFASRVEFSSRHSDEFFKALRKVTE